MQATIDSTKWLTRATAVGGTDRYLTGTSASGSAYVVAPVGNPLTAYTDGQTFNWKPDVTASGNHTVAISGLAAKKTYQADGTTRAGASDVIAGRGVLIQYDSTLDAAAGGFKIVNAGGAAAGGDFSSNTSSSVDSEIVLFSSTAGKTGKRATGTGLPHVTSGVLSVSSPTNHGVMVGQGSSAPVATSAGTTGQVLTSNGASADPTFQAATGGSPGTYWGSASSGKTAGSAFCTITGVTTATPAVVTCSSAHFASTGQHRYVSGVGGMGGVNNTAHPYYWTITLVDTTRYSLDGSTGTGTYTSGGTANDSTVHCYSGGGSGQPTCLNAYMPVATT